MQNLGKIRQFPYVILICLTKVTTDVASLCNCSYSVRDNLVIDSVEEVVEEMKLFKAAGGGSVVDLTPIGIRTFPELLPRVAMESGVNIVLGTGYYVEAFQSEEIRAMPMEDMAEVMVREIQFGIGEAGVKCGVIGEIGCSWPLAECEKKALCAGALAQQKTGESVCVCTCVCICAWCVCVYMCMCVC